MIRNEVDRDQVLTPPTLPRGVQVAVFVGLVLLGLVGRLWAPLPDFTPVAACALFAGFFLSKRGMALCVPLAAMLLANLFLPGPYDIRIMAAVYAALLFPVFLRHVIRCGRFRAVRIGACSLLMSTIFFVVTNFAVWAFSGMYPATLSGLTACYVAALPFFRNTLLGDLSWCTIIFGVHALMTAGVSLSRLRWSRAYS